MIRSLSATGASLLLLAGFAPLHAEAWARASADHSLPPGALGAGQDLYLDVTINGAPIGLIAAFRQRPDGTLSIAADELSEIGLRSAGAGQATDGMIDLDRLSCLSYQYNSTLQQIHIAAEDRCRRANSYQGGGATTGEASLADAPESGAVVNYSFFASSYADIHDLDALDDQQPTLSLGIDSWMFGPWGVFSQSGTFSTNSADLYDSVRLDTRWSFSDQAALLTYSAGDVVGGGLAWTRPMRLAGVQVQRDFALRPDLITMPVPTLSGSAAVPSTVDVYANNVRVFSQKVPTGPFEIVNVPVITGSGMAQVVVRDALGRDTVTNVPYYASSQLLKRGLYDFSVEGGFPRTYYGTLSNSYDDNTTLLGTLRYGVSDALTFEGHAEGSSELINGGVGLVGRVASIGIVSGAVAGSHTSDGSGVLVSGGLEFRHGTMAFNLRGQYTFGDYADAASVSAPRRVGDLFPDFGLPEQLVQAVFSFMLPFDPSTFTLSYTELTSRDFNHSILGASLSRTVFEDCSLIVSAAFDFANNETGLIYLGLSKPLGPGMSSNVSASENRNDTVVGADLVKSERMEPGSYGWRLRDREGSQSERMVAASYRGETGRIEGRVQQFGDALSFGGQFDGAVAVADGSVFLAPTITSAFAVADTGAPDTQVYLENRPVGRTNSQGRLLVTNLNPYQRNSISIDPRSVPLDADVPKTKSTVVPAARRGPTVRFGITERAPSALIVITDRDGQVLPAGSSVSLAGGEEERFVMGYDGQVYLRGLGDTNTVMVRLASGYTCTAAFTFERTAGEQVIIPAVCQ
jgi:outer membrane usher protein